MRVLQPLTFGFVLLVQGSQRSHLAGVEGDVDGLLSVVTRLQELDGDHSRLGSDGDQLQKPVGGPNLAVFELEALCLEDTEELLDDPALLLYHSTIRQASSAPVTP
ncbi:hypothetical protein ACVWWR_003715 [Bradyrhizobium sp. LM3.2]